MMQARKIKYDVIRLTEARRHHSLRAVYDSGEELFLRTCDNRKLRKRNLLVLITVASARVSEHLDPEDGSPTSSSKHMEYEEVIPSSYDERPHSERPYMGYCCSRGRAEVPPAARHSGDSAFLSVLIPNACHRRLP
ncbi:unnamed protein product [Heligmosomoides polygyrus]|uniref:Uncharacterized protein n=1 Tax=Heligmosomoides polygyrus TaxID=6339 RepID=A0A183F556_HELPZ|nr:unnamed protein product [Heligmosomoides polygyrus]